MKDAEIPFLGFTKKSSTLTRVVWAGDSKTGLGIKIGPRQHNLWHGSQCVTDWQSSCKSAQWPGYCSDWGLVLKHTRGSPWLGYPTAFDLVVTRGDTWRVCRSGMNICAGSTQDASVLRYAFWRTSVAAYIHQRTKPIPFLKESTDTWLNTGNSQRYRRAALGRTPDLTARSKGSFYSSLSK